MDSSCGILQNQPDAKLYRGFSVSPSMPLWSFIGTSATKCYTKILKSRTVMTKYELSPSTTRNGYWVTKTI